MHCAIDFDSTIIVLMVPWGLGALNLLGRTAPPGSDSAPGLASAPWIRPQPWIRLPLDRTLPLDQGPPIRQALPPGLDPDPWIEPHPWIEPRPRIEPRPLDPPDPIREEMDSFVRGKCFSAKLQMDCSGQREMGANGVIKDAAPQSGQPERALNPKIVLWNTSSRPNGDG